MTSCPRFGKLFGSCRFSPRYDRVSATQLSPVQAFCVGPADKLPKASPARTTYVRDVCERCGKTVERN